MKIVYRALLILVIVVLAGILFSLMTDNDYLNLLARTGLTDTVPDADDEEDDDDEQAAQTVWHEGIRAVGLTVEQQQQSGIKTVPIEAITLQHEVKSFSRVIDLQPMLDLRAEYMQVRAEKRIDRARYNNTHTTLEQLQRLNRETSNVSSRKLQEVEAELRVLKESLGVHDLRLDGIKRKLAQTWGSEIADMVLDADSEILRRILNREEVLLLLSLKSNQTLRENARFIYVNRTADRINARKAWIISEGTHVDPVMQGETFYLRTSAENLRVGMRLHSWIETDDRYTTGVVIPDQAVLWHDGQPWVYIKVDEELFSRMALINPIDTGAGVLVQENLEAGDEVVITGGQTLLSEENRLQIPDEDDD